MPLDIRIRFGRAIRRIREEQGINQEEAAERCGLHRTYFEEFPRIETNAVEKKKVRSPSTPHEGLIGLSAKARLRCLCDFAPQ